MSKCTKNSQTAVFALVKRGAGAKPIDGNLRKSKSLPPPRSSRGPPPSSEGGKICECEQSFLNNEIQSFLLFISQYSMLALTFYLPLRREGDRRRVPGNALSRFWGSGDGGGGRDIICFSSHLCGVAPAPRYASTNIGLLFIIYNL